MKRIEPLRTRSVPKKKVSPLIFVHFYFVFLVNFVVKDILLSSRKRLAVLFLALFLAAPAWSKPDHVVLGYSGYWFDDIYPPEAYNFEALTHIARSFLVPLTDGHIPVPKRFFDPALTKGAKDHGVKLIASLGGGAAGSDTWFSIAKNGGYRKTFFDELEKLIN